MGDGDNLFTLWAHLARAEAQIAFSTLLRRFPALAPESDVVEWQPNPGFRGLKALPVFTHRLTGPQDVLNTT